VGTVAGIALPKMVSTSSAKKAAVAFHRDPAGDGSILTYASEAFTLTSKGYSRNIEKQIFKPEQILYVTRLAASESAAKSLLDEIASNFSSATTPIAPVAIEFKASTPPNTGVDGAALGFATGVARDAFCAALSELARETGLMVRCFKSQAKVTAKVAYGSLEKAISKLLVDQRREGRWEETIISDVKVVLHLVLWIDACDSQTAVRIRLSDPKRVLFQRWVSPVAPFMTWVGGEELMHSHDAWLIEQINHVETTKFVPTNNIIVAIRFERYAGDHHSLGPATGTAQGRSEHRDTMSRSLSSYYARVFAQDFESRFCLNSLLEDFQSFCSLSNQGQSPDRIVIAREVAATRVAARVVGKMFTASPMFMQGRIFKLNTKICPPVMHNLVFYNSGNLDRLMNFVLKGHRSAASFLVKIAHNNRTSADGKIAMCAASYRQLIIRAHVEFEDVLLNDVEVRLQIFAPLLRFMVYLSRHIYGGLEPTPQRHLTFSTSCVGTWLLSVLLGNFANLHHGSEKKLLALEPCIVDLPVSGLKNALQSLYGGDLIHMIRCDYESKEPWITRVEDAFEAMFRDHQLHTEATRRQTDLPGEEVKATYKEVAQSILPVKSMPSGINQQSPVVATQNLVFCSCLIDRSNGRFRPLITFNIMRFLEETASKTEVCHFASVLHNNSVFFKLKSENERLPGPVQNTVLCLSNCSHKAFLTRLEATDAFGSQRKFSLREFVSLRNLLRLMRRRHLLKLLPHLENDLAWRRVHNLEMKLQLAPASQKNSVKERLLFWKGRVDPRFPAPATAFRAPEFPE